MKIVLRVDRNALRRWHLMLAERLAGRDGVRVGFDLAAGAAPPPRGLDALFQIETWLFGLGSGASARIEPQALAAYGDGVGGDLTLDLAAVPSVAAGRALRVECDGAGLEPGLLAALLAGRSPTVRLSGLEGVAATARPGAERIGLIKTAFEETLARVATLIEAALDGAAASVPPSLPGEAAATDSAPPQIRRRALATVRRSAIRAAYAALCHAPHWRVGWRRGLGGFAEGGGWTDLPDDGRRFFADPFPVVWRGRTFLFVEEFVHALGKGVISAVEFGPQGPLGQPERALERPVHLSYPNVFERDGEMWMIPESGAAGTIDLYRARDFPGRWTLERTLVSGVFASDATLVEHDGRWWMFATVQDGGGSFSDALWLWSAAELTGPWTPHKRNPVLIDIATARPAGRMFSRDGALYRPVQDCRAGYGAALGFARVDRLDGDGFSQTLAKLVKPGGPDWPGQRLHSYNAAGGFEFIDGSALAPRWPVLRRPLQTAQRWALRPARA
jgi:hypothetical protein